MADRRGWHPQRAALAPRGQVATYDRRSHGDTPAVNEPHSARADLRRVRDDLNIGRAVLAEFVHQLPPQTALE